MQLNIMQCTPAARSHSEGSKHRYAAAHLYDKDMTSVIYYLPQLVQALRYDDEGQIEEFLKKRAQERGRFATLLMWTLQGEEAPPWCREPREDEDAKSWEKHMVRRSGWKEPKENSIWPIVERVRSELLNGIMRGKELFERESALLDRIMAVSIALKDLSMEERKESLTQHLECALDAFVRRHLVISDSGEKALFLGLCRSVAEHVDNQNIILPTDYKMRIVKLLPESGKPLQSATKVPIMVSFLVEDMETLERQKKVSSPIEYLLQQEHKPLSSALPTEINLQGCIFKVGDDSRQDVLALQLVHKLKSIWASAQLPIEVRPYGVIPTGYERGVIEMIQNVHSRDEIGALVDGGIVDAFKSMCASNICGGMPRYSRH